MLSILTQIADVKQPLRKPPPHQKPPGCGVYTGDYGDSIMSSGISGVQ